MQLKQALWRTYSPLYGKALDPHVEIAVHTGGTEAILSCIAAFVNPGDEIIILELAFNLYAPRCRLPPSKQLTRT